MKEINKQERFYWENGKFMQEVIIKTEVTLNEILHLKRTLDENNNGITEQLTRYNQLKGEFDKGG